MDHLNIASIKKISSIDYLSSKPIGSFDSLGAEKLMVNWFRHELGEEIKLFPILLGYTNFIVNEQGAGWWAAYFSKNEEKLVRIIQSTNVNFGCMNSWIFNCPKLT